MANEPPKSIFNPPSSTSSSPAPNLFAGINPESTNLFGPADPGKSAGGAWNFSGFGKSSAGENKTSNGATADNKPSTGFGGFGGGSGAPGFGSLGGSHTPQKPLFGGFGGASTGGTTMTPAGSTTPAPALSFKPSTTPAGPPPTNLFGASTGENKSNASPLSLGASTNTANPASAGNLFGDKSKQPLTSFNWPKPAESSQATAPGSTSTAQPQNQLFGNLNLSKNPSSTTPSTEPQKPLFGNLGQNTSNAPATSADIPSFNFVNPTLNSEDFKKLNPPNTQASTPGGLHPQSAFGRQVQRPSTSPPATSAPALGNFFSKTPTTSSTTPSTNVFSLGTPAPATSASGTPTPSTSATATTSAPFSTFKKPDQPASTAAPSTSQPAATTTAPATTGATAMPGGLNKSILGASTSGPAPPAQSRLRNKTMDEILTRWASDLTKYTNEFQSHAETIAHWDQLLVENMSKISKLYVSAVTAEKQTAAVEMQLSAVENQQNELEAWLGRYENEVDEMLARNGGLEVSEGPDQERERTYKLAEKLGERLEDMGRDLASMIEEVNAANASLSRTTKGDEPITHIVRILNSHLSQLQAIDQGTVALQAKVNAAQKASQELGFPGINGNNGNAGGGGAVEDFYRSYMGRR